MKPWWALRFRHWRERPDEHLEAMLAGAIGPLDPHFKLTVLLELCRRHSVQNSTRTGRVNGTRLDRSDT